METNPEWDDGTDPAYNFNAPMFTDFGEDDDMGDEFGDNLLTGQQAMEGIPEEWLTQMNALGNNDNAKDRVVSNDSRSKIVETLPNNENSMNTWNAPRPIPAFKELLPEDVKEVTSEAVEKEIEDVKEDIVDEIILDEMTFLTNDSGEANIVDEICLETEEKTAQETDLSGETGAVATAVSPPIPPKKSVPSYLLPTEAFRARSSVDIDRKKHSHKPGELTHPVTPFLATRNRSRGSPIQSSTTQELEAITKMRNDKKLELQKQKDVFVMSKKAPERRKVERQTLTQPVTPMLKASHRPRAIAKDAVPKKSEEQRHSKPMKLTQPKPFKLRTAAKPIEEAQVASPYVSLAEQVNVFQSKTPRRFHSTLERKPVVTHSEPKLTEPVELNLSTNTRVRPVSVMSADQAEEQMMSSVPVFRARPLNSKILSSAGDLGVPKVEKKALCVPRGFNFRTDSRSRRTRSNSIDSCGSGKTERSITSRMSSRPKQQPKPTLVVPFNLSANRLRPPSPRVESEEQVKIKARKMPNFEKREHVPRKLVQSTKSSPFELSSMKLHEQAMERRQQELVRAAEEEERSRNFAARPVPDFSKSPKMHHPSHKPLTEPKTPVALARSIEHQQHVQQKIMEARALEMRSTEFRAQPLPETTYKKDFSPTHEVRVTESHLFTLMSDLRANERSQFDKQMHQKIQMQLLEKEREQVRKQELEAMEVKDFRRKLVHKAMPVPDYNEISNRYSSNTEHRARPLTVPESPYLETKVRNNNHQ